MVLGTARLHETPFSELFRPAALKRLDDAYLALLAEKDPALKDALLAYREGKSTLSDIETSELLISCAIILDAFLAHFFHIEEEVAIQQALTTANNPIAAFKKYYLLRRAKKDVRKAPELPSFDELTTWLMAALKAAPIQADDLELGIALLGNHYLENAAANQDNIEKLVAWCIKAMTTPEGQAVTAVFSSFKLPERVDHNKLVMCERDEADPLKRIKAHDTQLRQRDGFKLTDPRMSARDVQDEVNYCIYCHDHDGDFCSKGFPVKKGDPEQGFKKNPLDVTLTGCPLEEKISEMQRLKRDGYTLASLAMVMVDNPMCPATGHRICNDCMKACVYQKQTPVNIPQIETRVLTDALDLPFGVEIYDLLTRWNPLRKTQWIAKPYNGLKVMIAGMGPAGFTLAHHLLQDGFAVVGFDGLKIEPLPEKLIHEPIRHFSDLKESLDERLMAGFGGVAEYGITVRWDKNFLKLIYLTLMRRPHFQVFGNVRFGGTITIEDAWEMGFDHFVVAVGAGLPKALSIPNSLTPGMRQANDFLMALQLGNAAKASSLTNLQIRLPAVVIGGGLTGVDTATELQAYYITQVEKIAKRFHILVNEYGKENILDKLDEAQRNILTEYLAHAEEAKNERELASKENRQPDFIRLIRQWGGVTIAYRRSMQESPAYINNHEELQKALEEGIYYLEGLEPAAVDLDNYGHAQALICHRRIKNENHEWITTKEEVRLPARSILAATGTQPNTAYEFEHRGTFNRLNLQYQHYEDRNGELVVAHGVAHCKDPEFGPFTSYHHHDRRVSLVGDTHPVFHGNVVKAIASGMRAHPKITAILRDKLNQLGNEKEYQHFAQNMQHWFNAKVVKITRHTPEIIELHIQAPLAAKHYKPGVFYRLQNFETYAPHIDHTLFQMEPLALVAAGCDESNGILHFIVHEKSASAKLCATLKPNEPVALMGPTGVRAKIPSEHETVLIIGNQASFPFVRSFGTAMRQAGNHVLFVAQLNSSDEAYCQEALQNATDEIIWLTKNSSLINASRAQDLSFHTADAITTLAHYAQNKLEHNNLTIKLGDIDRIYVIGTTDLLRRFQAARHTVLKDYLLKDPKVFGAVYGNMQCMLKGVCAQCLQWQIDPETGQRTKAVFACSWQDQPLEIIDIDHIDERRAQNALLDQISQRWVDHLFAAYQVERI